MKKQSDKFIAHDTYKEHINPSRYSQIVPPSSPSLGPQMNRTTLTPAPVVEMEVRSILNINKVISDFIEKDIKAWKFLPESLKSLMISSPERFQFLYRANQNTESFPNLVFNSVELKWDGNTSQWFVVGIV